jgi:hypothetical protein
MPDVERPTGVVMGVLLFLICALLGLVALLAAPAGGSRWTTIVVVALNFGLPLAVWERRNWARIVLLLLFLTGLLGLLLRLSVMQLLSMPSEGAVARALVLTQIVLQVAAFACLFSRSSNAWFREGVDPK